MFPYISIVLKILWISVFSVLGLIIIRIVNPIFLEGHSDWNAPPAFLAAGLLLVVLLPGCLQRIGVRNRFVRILTAWRRVLGVLMYLAALVHALFLLDYIPQFSGGEIVLFDLVTATGLVSLTLLLPVLVTSNSFSVRFLGRFWKILQRMTYLVIPLVAVHFWEAGEAALSVLYVVFTVFVILSYLIKGYQRKSLLSSTIIGILGTTLIAGVVLFFSLKYLYFDPRTVALQKEFMEIKTRIDEIASEHDILRSRSQDELSGLDDARARLLEFEQIIAEEEVIAEEKARAEEVARIALEEELRREKEAKQKEEEEIEAAQVAAEAEAARIAALSDYKDGTYTGVGNYSTDKGDKTERIDVRISIANDIVEGVEIISHAKANKSVKYVNRFNKDIGGIVVGKDIDTLDVHGIGGASDTSTGFRTALGSIKAQAQQ